ncbi:C39 family peptidase [Kitasatospora terrestris]|uniref:Peptidase C39 family protein n=1 Tax=Kitasatospora terrestris TaxID=258051 RepID=A0ABP9D9P4_9ACTN
MTGHTARGPAAHTQPQGRAEQQGRTRAGVRTDLPGRVRHPAAGTGGQVALHRWDGAAAFASGTLEGLAVADGAPVFPGRTALVWEAPAGSAVYADPFGHRPRTWEWARWTSPWTEACLATPHPHDHQDPDGPDRPDRPRDDGRDGLGGRGAGEWHAQELVPSWSATGPAGCRVTVRLQVRDAAGAVSGWFTMARWAAGDEVVHRTTVPGQADAFGAVDVDTFTAAPGRPVAAFRVRAVVHRLAEEAPADPPAGTGAHPKPGPGSDTDGGPDASTAGPAGDAVADVLPALHSLAVLASRAPAPPLGAVSGPGGGWGTVLDVPRRSQEVHTGHCPQYDGGGEAWAGPACTAMLTAYFGRGPAADDLTWLDPHDPAPDVDFTARAVYDYAYRGCGNWAFNAAYPARWGLLGLVTRLRSLAELERFILAGIPVATAQAARSSELGGYTSAGNIMVVCGFTPHGDVVVNDPLSPTDETVRRTYPRTDFERVWLTGGGVVYLLHPPDHPLPAPVPGHPANW